MLGSFGELELAIWLLHTGECIGQIELGEGAASDQEANAVGGRPIGETVLDAVALEFMTVGGAEDLVACDLGGDDLADDVFVGEADY